MKKYRREAKDASQEGKLLREDSESRGEKVNEKVAYISIATIMTRLENHAYS